MKLRRCIGALVLAALLGLIVVDVANAYGRRYVAPQMGYSYYWVEPFNPYYAPYGSVTPGYGYGYGYGYNPYGFSQLPAYGIMPAPLATLEMMYKDGLGFNQPPQVDADLMLPPRARASIYPAVPYEKTPQEKQQDKRRVRFEINVPDAKAIVKFDGVATKQTGLQRVFVTAPLQEEKEYTVTIEAQWLHEDKMLKRTKTFTVVAGESVQHTFIP